MQLESPANNYVSPNYTITFWWNTFDHALSYHLQVVTPTFAAPGSLLFDTIVTVYKFTYTLKPGSYQWRVMGENGSSQTAYSAPNSFTVVSTAIAQQAVQLSTPAKAYFTLQASVIFQWSSLYVATKYLFK